MTGGDINMWINKRRTGEGDEQDQKNIYKKEKQQGVNKKRKLEVSDFYKNFH